MSAVAWSQTANIVIAVAAVVVAVGTIWRYAVRPPLQFARRLETSMAWVESQTRQNGGSTLLDKIIRVDEKTDVLIARADALETRVQAQERTDHMESALAVDARHANTEQTASENRKTS